ncbi:hypothetical protein ASG67_06985 [Sphingomonas sp. Leaf339]|uniref:hypothetical protein n=1 Tax=Sphingomonas sp. Leaf339 TaxID=1736343 RepID=UPI0006F5FDE4|nr:hypothetical protein [Sphingomonas sp. Leaf339]KQU55849.1 hypothetical protein ASG67_06985 [Sphingomonas sp. Leaf339]
MTLRIEKPVVIEQKGVVLEGVPGATAAPAMAVAGDDWGTRIAKLVPAEALGLYGSAVALVQTPSASVRVGALWVIVAICAVLTIFIRYRSTLDPATGRPQWPAIAISLVSFILWLTAIGAPTSPIALPEGLAFAGPLAALLWGAVLPYIYRGE